MKVLNLYAGVGGNRHLWGPDCQVTAVESDPKIAAIYKKLHPQDTVIIGDAHQYLLDHYDEFDFIWSSAPCQSRTALMKFTRHKLRRYTEMALYQEVIFLEHFARDRLWCAENVAAYHDELIQPSASIGRHRFWANFDLQIDSMPKLPSFPNFINRCDLNGKKALMKWLGMHYEENIYYKGNHCPAQVLRNCVHPLIGQHIFNQAINHHAALLQS